MRWRIYYADPRGELSAFDSEMGEPEDSPIYGVLCIIQLDDDHNRVILTWNMYYFNEHTGSWFGSDSPADICQRVAHGFPVRALRYGATVPTELMREVLTKAHNDPDFPPQTGPNPIIEAPKYMQIDDRWIDDG